MSLQDCPFPFPDEIYQIGLLNWGPPLVLPHFSVDFDHTLQLEMG
jgi:hypothetical protein